MDFSQLDFWLVLGTALLVLQSGNLFLGGNVVFQKVFICVLSLLLLGMASLQTLCVFLCVAVGAYIVCRLSVDCRPMVKTIVLSLLIPLLFMPLLYYKYSYFLASSVLGLEWDTLHHMVIPIGISFYSFQVVGFCVDTLVRGYRMPTFLNYMNFCAFFPQIVAGPIERRDDLLPQISEPRMTLCCRDLREGVPYVLLGLFFKMALADNLSFCMQPDYCEGNAFIIWTNNLLFTFRIYFDFGGYGMTAYGVARCLGITLRMNFLSPYTATNISEFWRRWHTSLTQWFRDYIYFPLGGSRTPRWALNIMIVFLVSGLWHGAGWNFIVWGGFSGVAMVLHRIFRKKELHLPSVLGWGMTFGMMVFVWMFFYITDWNILMHHLEVISHASSYDVRGYLQGLMTGKYAGAMTWPFLMLSFGVIVTEAVSLRLKASPYALLLHPISLAIMTFMIVMFGAGQESTFIYFAF